MLGNCVVCKEAGIKASPSAACARGTGRDGLEKIYYADYKHRISYKGNKYQMLKEQELSYRMVEKIGI